jgi:hypothetical protein
VAVELADYIPSLKREVSVPGTTGILDAASQAELIGALADAFWLAKLDGFFSAWTCDEYGTVEPTTVGGADIPRNQISVIILYAGIKVIRNKILGTGTTFRAKAGSVEYETSTSANVLTEMLKQLRETQKALLEQVQGGYDDTVVEVFDWLARYVPIED